MLDTFLAIYQRIEKRTTHANGFCAQTQRLHNVCPSPDTAVDIDLQFIEDFRRMSPYLEQREQRGRGSTNRQLHSLVPTPPGSAPIRDRFNER